MYKKIIVIFKHNILSKRQIVVEQLVKIMHKERRCDMERLEEKLVLQQRYFPLDEVYSRCDITYQVIILNLRRLRSDHYHDNDCL